jgi:ribonuclease HI
MGLFSFWTFARQSITQHHETAPMTDSRPQVDIFSDGACSGNPGPGGWGTLLHCGKHVRELSGFDPCTTNNRMELMGAIAGLEALKRPCRVNLTTDSRYVQKGITEWIHGWIRKGWKNSRKEDVANRDLWERLLELTRRHQVEWHWIRGHAGHAENERCDQLARDAIRDGRNA